MKIYLGSTQLKHKKTPVTGSFVNIDGENYYKISAYDQMPPFFISIVSSSDHWLFISSKGGLTAGRKNSDNALFPYYTDDKIHENSENTGSKTILHIKHPGKNYLWEPFSERYKDIYNLSRNLYKNIAGNKIIFEEENHDLQLTFRYAWLNSEEFGLVKKSRIYNKNKASIRIKVLDGIQNILPSGVNQQMQNESSTLVDGYKKCELVEKTGLGIFTLSSIPTDKAEPSEALRATSIWTVGIERNAILLSTIQLDAFRAGETIRQERIQKGVKGAYLINSEIILDSEKEQTWWMVAEINQSTTEVINLNEWLEKTVHKQSALKKSIAEGTEKLIKTVATADGLQKTNNKFMQNRHFSNVMFNVMRGGVFDNNYSIQPNDLKKFIKKWNKKVYHQHQKWISTLPQYAEYDKVIKKSSSLKDNHLTRLLFEYMPLIYSRRHGDPSRPWNKFSINIKNDDGSDNLNYQGNWRDIFQNWEALAVSFPEYTESMICKFVNASTADGYNPYRITRNGIDWETIDPSDPWSYIGYWGDHQLIYLLKLMEWLEKIHQGKLLQLFSKKIFVYANVPYSIKPYEECVINPQDTITYSHDAEAAIKEKVKEWGSDGKLLFNKKGDICNANLLEKILVSMLAKISNFIPEAGIWMNTQRPEWNDANNALVGNGASMITLYYLRRYIFFLRTLLENNKASFDVSVEVAILLNKIIKILESNKHLLHKSISNENRKVITEQLGKAGSAYRNSIYKQGFSGKSQNINSLQLTEFLTTTLLFVNHTIACNQREDKLFHSYNLVTFCKDEIKISRLYEMLEGQAAILSSGYLQAKAAIEVLDALRHSQMYRPDQNSYTLYPDKKLPSFLEKNKIPDEKIEKSALLKELITSGNKEVIEQDVTGQYHFNGTLRNASELKEKLEKMMNCAKWGKLIEKEKELIAGWFEEIFNHHAFTGRSGTFFKYEGLGCIYWHMVSKLLLAVQENFFLAIKQNENKKTIDQFKQQYYTIKDGLGITKSPEEYGAFTTDPYSHTPSFIGVQQPGLTGQVKEDILSRWGELGLMVEKGTIYFSKKLLHENEYLKTTENFEYFDVKGRKKTIQLPAHSLAFTFCQIPVVYKSGNKELINIHFDDNTNQKIFSLTLDQNTSKHIFSRNGEIKKIEVVFKN